MGGKKAWDKELALRLYAQGHTDKAIASRTGVTPQTIARWRAANALPAKHGRSESPGRKAQRAEPQTVRELHEVGASDTLMSNLTGVSRDNIAKVRSEMDLASNYVHSFDEAAARKAYDAGWHDAEIARIAGISPSTVASWRERNHLAANKYVSGSVSWGSRDWDRDEARRLYELGLPDTRIGNALGISAATIRKWRAENNLRVNVRKAFEESDIERLYYEGKTDAEIAKILNISYGPPGAWRKKRGLPPNRMKFDEETAMRLWKDGANDMQIAAALGVCRQRVDKWRAANDLARNSARKLDEEQALALYQRGLNDVQIAKKLGFSMALETARILRQISDACLRPIPYL